MDFVVNQRGVYYFRYIENGRNPDVYTREFVELTGKQNQYINGKMKAMRVCMRLEEMFKIGPEGYNSNVYRPCHPYLKKQKKTFIGIP